MPEVNPFDLLEWEVSLHDGHPESATGAITNELGFPGYSRQILIRDGTEQEISFPPMPESRCISHLGFIAGGHLMAYAAIHQILAEGDRYSISTRKLKVYV